MSATGDAAEEVGAVVKGEENAEHDGADAGEGAPDGAADGDGGKSTSTTSDPGDDAPAASPEGETAAAEAAAGETETASEPVVDETSPAVDETSPAVASTSAAGGAPDASTEGGTGIDDDDDDDDEAARERETEVDGALDELVEELYASDDVDVDGDMWEVTANAAAEEPEPEPEPEPEREREREPEREASPAAARRGKSKKSPYNPPPEIAKLLREQAKAEKEAPPPPPPPPPPTTTTTTIPRVEVPDWSATNDEELMSTIDSFLKGTKKTRGRLKQRVELKRAMDEVLSRLDAEESRSSPGKDSARDGSVRSESSRASSSFTGRDKEYIEPRLPFLPAGGYKALNRSIPVYPGSSFTSPNPTLDEDAEALINDPTLARFIREEASFTRPGKSKSKKSPYNPPPEVAKVLREQAAAEEEAAEREKPFEHYPSSPAQTRPNSRESFAAARGNTGRGSGVLSAAALRVHREEETARLHGGVDAFRSGTRDEYIQTRRPPRAAMSATSTSSFEPAREHMSDKFAQKSAGSVNIAAAADEGNAMSQYAAFLAAAMAPASGDDARDEAAAAAAVPPEAAYVRGARGGASGLPPRRPPSVNEREYAYSRAREPEPAREPAPEYEDDSDIESDEKLQATLAAIRARMGASASTTRSASPSYASGFVTPAETPSRPTMNGFKVGGALTPMDSEWGTEVASDFGAPSERARGGTPTPGLPAMDSESRRLKPVNFRPSSRKAAAMGKDSIEGRLGQPPSWTPLAARTLSSREGR